MSTSRTVLVPAERLVRWFNNFGTRHGGPTLAVRDGRLVATAPDGAVAEAALPFGQVYDGPPDVSGFRDAVLEPVRWGVLLVRKGGFAVAAGTSASIAASKVGSRHVQGRTKAGGQSQQRFARRRDNQARQAYEAAADHAHRILVQEAGGVVALVCGGRPGSGRRRAGRPPAQRPGRPPHRSLAGGSRPAEKRARPSGRRRAICRDHGP